MKSPIDQEHAVRKYCESMIHHRLGDISKLPEPLAAHINRIYCEFIAIYLKLLRRKQNKPTDWFPATRSIDPELADEMRHFFSDYQHITKDFFTLNSKMDRLKEIDKKRQPNLYRHAIESILALHDRPLEPKGLT